MFTVIYNDILSIFDSNRLLNGTLFVLVSSLFLSTAVWANIPSEMNSYQGPCIEKVEDSNKVMETLPPQFANLPVGAMESEGQESDTGQETSPEIHSADKNFSGHLFYYKLQSSLPSFGVDDLLAGFARTEPRPPNS